LQRTHTVATEIDFLQRCGWLEVDALEAVVLKVEFAKAIRLTSERHARQPIVIRKDLHDARRQLEILEATIVTDEVLDSVGQLDGS